jgi:hypothetical protein
MRYENINYLLNESYYANTQYTQIIQTKKAYQQKYLNYTLFFIYIIIHTQRKHYLCNTTYSNFRILFFK